MHRGAGIEFGGRLLLLGVAAIVLFVLAAMAAPSISAQVDKYYKMPKVSGSAAWGVVHIVVFVLAIMLLLALARFL
jgi:hypothetical protein